MRASGGTAARIRAGGDTAAKTTELAPSRPRLTPPRSMPCLRRCANGDVAEAELAERIECGHHRLVRRARIGAQQHAAIAVIASHLRDRALERIDVGAQHFA